MAPSFTSYIILVRFFSTSIGHSLIMSVRITVKIKLSNVSQGDSRRLLHGKQSVKGRRRGERKREGGLGPEPQREAEGGSPQAVSWPEPPGRLEEVKAGLPGPIPSAGCLAGQSVRGLESRAF